MPNNNDVLLKVENLKQYFTSGRGKKKVYVKAVDGINFEIKKGETFGLVGESGCGKTTTGRAIIKLYNITDGNVYFKGEKISAGAKSFHDEISRLNKEAKNKIKEIKTSGNEVFKDEILKIKKELKTRVDDLKIEINNVKRDNKIKTDLMMKMQMIFQDPIASLNPRMTVKEIIAEGLRIHGEKNEKVIEEKVYNMLKTVGLLPEHASRYPHEFSGGQRQRIGVSRSLIVEPELIIADEPISALDVSIQAQVINLLNDLKKDLGLTILFIAHDLSVVKYFSDRIGVMYYGKLVELASGEEIFKNPLHPYTKSLLSAVPLPDPNYEKNRKRIKYHPNCHDYSIEQPSMVEITPDHFIYASPSEIEAYRKELK